MAGQLWNELHVALHVLDDQLVHAVEIGADQIGQAVQRIALAVLAPPGFEIDDNGHADIPT